VTTFAKALVFLLIVTLSQACVVGDEGDALEAGPDPSVAETFAEIAWDTCTVSSTQPARVGDTVKSTATVTCKETMTTMTIRAYLKRGASLATNQTNNWCSNVKTCSATAQLPYVSGDYSVMNYASVLASDGTSWASTSSWYWHTNL